MKVWIESLWRSRKLDWVDLAEAQGVEGSVRASLVLGVRGSRKLVCDVLTGVDGDMSDITRFLQLLLGMTVSMLWMVRALLGQWMRTTLG